MQEPSSKDSDKINNESFFSPLFPIVPEWQNYVLPCLFYSLPDNKLSPPSGFCGKDNLAINQLGGKNYYRNSQDSKMD